MSKKVVQSAGNGKNKPVKKKKHGCRNCLITLLVFIVLIGVGGYFAGNYFSQKYLDMSLASCFGVINDVRTAKRSKIVSNGYSDNDYAEFDVQLKKQLFLNENVDFGVDTLISAITDGEDSGSANLDAVTKSGDYFTRTVSALGASLNTDSLVNKLSDIYVKENLDLERLRNYDESLHEREYVFKVSDKMLAAAIENSLDTIGGSVSAVSEFLDNISVEKLSDIARVDQLIFGEHDGKKDGADAKVKTLTATVSADARKVAKSYITQGVGSGFLGKLLSGVAKVFLPKRVYLTAVVPIESGATLENNVYINSMSDKKMNRAFKLVENVISLTGNKMDVREKITSMMEDTVAGVIDKVNDIIPLDSAADGTVSLDIFETLIDLADINKDGEGNLKPEEDRLHAPDMIQTLAGVMTSDSEQAVPGEYAYKNQWREDATDKVVYVKTKNPGDEIDGMTWIDYKVEFMKEISTKYMLDLRDKDDDPDNDVTFEDLMRLFGLGDELENTKQLELMDLFVGKNLGNVLDIENPDDRKVKVDARMLGAILQTQINSLTADGGSLGTYIDAIEYVRSYATTDGEGKPHNLMEAGISVKINELLPEGNTAASLMSGLVGDKAVIIFTLDITPTEEEGFAFIAGKVRYNDLTEEKTEVILKTISSFVSDFDRASLLGQVEEPMRKTMREMNKVIKVNICSSKIDLEATQENMPAMELPTVFETIADMVFKDKDIIPDEQKDTVTKAEGVEAVLTDIYAPERSADYEIKYLEGTNKSETYETSLGDILEKYYLVDTVDDGNGGQVRITKFDQLFGADGIITSGDAFDSSVIKFEELYHDDAETDAMHPIFRDGDLAALLTEMMKEDDEKTASDVYAYLNNLKGVKIKIAQNGDPVLTMIFEVDSDRLIGSESEKYSKLMPASKVFLKAEIDLSKNAIGYYDKATGTKYENASDAADGVVLTQYYKTEITFNDMTDDTFAIAVKMMNSLNESDGGAGSTDSKKGFLDLNATACDIGAIVKQQTDKLESSLGGGFEYIDGGIKLVTVYDYIKTSVLTEEEQQGVTTEQVREALQGLAAMRVSQTGEQPENSRYNYDSGLFEINPVVTENPVHLPPYKDNEFGKVLSSIIAQDGFTLAQLNILHGSLNPRGDLLKGFTADSEISDKLVNMATDKTFIEFNFLMEKEKVVTSDSKLSNAIDDIYVSVLIEYTAGEEHPYGEVYFRINGIRQEAQNVLLKLAKINTDDIDTQISKCIDTLKGEWSNATFSSLISGEYTGGPIGRISLGA